jgi:TPR repeat protein
MYQLGHMYEHGQRVAKDRKQARQWYEKAAEAGDQNAKDRLRKFSK